MALRHYDIFFNSKRGIFSLSDDTAFFFFVNHFSSPTSCVKKFTESMCTQRRVLSSHMFTKCPVSIANLTSKYFRLIGKKVSHTIHCTFICTWDGYERELTWNSQLEAANKTTSISFLLAIQHCTVI